MLSLLGPSFASEIGPVTCSQTINKHVSTQMFAAKQARNEETRECVTVSGRDLVLLLGNCADTFEKNRDRSRFDRPMQSSRDPHATNLQSSLREEQTFLYVFVTFLKGDKIKRDEIINNYTNGGLKMLVPIGHVNEIMNNTMQTNNTNQANTNLILQPVLLQICITLITVSFMLAL